MDSAPCPAVGRDDAPGRLTTTPLDDVIAVLQIEAVAPDVYRGHHPDGQRERAFGGQIAAQALMAAAQTAPGRDPNSLHGMFVRIGDVSAPVTYHVTSLADGRTFARRRVTAIQHRQTIFEALISLTTECEGAGYQRDPPVVPPPESLERIEVQLAPYADEHDGWWIRPRAFDMRYVDVPPRIALDRPLPANRVNRLWARPDGPIPKDSMLSAGLLTYLSDLTLLDPVLVSTRRTSMGPGLIASLDHAIWFHRTPALTDWILYDQASPAAGAGRGLSTAAMFNRAGDLLCTVAQEGFLA